MAAKIIDGKAVAERMRAEVARQAAELSERGRKPKLASIIVGSPPAGLVYARSQADKCAQLGIDFELVQLSVDIETRQLEEKIDQLNGDPSITGIMMHLPLPQRIDTAMMQFRIDPYKDVEGVNPGNIGMVFYDQPIIAPCTALAVMELIKESGIEVRGAEAVVVGQGPVVGMPASVFLIQQLATVTCCHIATRDLAAHTRKADILVVAVGKAGLITGDMVKPGAVVIDVGINRVRETNAQGEQVLRTVGDCAFATVSEVAGAITPVPGGVGPVTVATLLRNTVEAARKQLEQA